MGKFGVKSAWAIASDMVDSGAKGLSVTGGLGNRGTGVKGWFEGKRNQARNILGSGETVSYNKEYYLKNAEGVHVKGGPRMTLEEHLASPLTAPRGQHSPLTSPAGKFSNDLDMNFHFDNKPFVGDMGDDNWRRALRLNARGGTPLFDFSPGHGITGEFLPLEMIPKEVRTQALGNYGRLMDDGRMGVRAVDYMKGGVVYNGKLQTPFHKPIPGGYAKDITERVLAEQAFEINRLIK
jgi:hypothetical protein